MVPCVDTQGPTLVARTINYRSGSTHGPTQVVGTIDHRSRRPRSPRLTATKAPMTYTGPYPYGSILRAGSPGLSTIEAGEYTQRRVSFLLSFRRAEHRSLVHKNPLSRAQHLPAGFTTLTNSKSWRSQKRSSWKYCRHTRQPLRGNWRTTFLFSAGNTDALPPAKEPGKMLILHQGVLVFMSSTHLEQMGVKEAEVHMFLLLFIQKKKPNLWVPGSSFQVLDPSYQVLDPSFQVPDPSFRPPYYHFPWQWAKRINDSHQHARSRGDSRRGDESSNDVQRMLRVTHPRGSREQPGQKNHLILVNSCYPNNQFRLQTQVNSCLWTNLGPRSLETMSTHTLQTQGRRSTVALPERTKAHRECRPGAKSKHIAPYARDTTVIGKADGEARQHPLTSMFQKGLPQNLRDISVIAGFQEYTSEITEGKDLRQAKRTINCRTTHPTKVLLPRSCPIDLEDITNGSTEETGAISTTAHIQSSSRVVHLRRTERDVGFETAKKMFTSGCNIYRSSRVRALIPRNLQVPKDKSTGPTGPEHEALESLRFQRRIIRDYDFLHDVCRYLRVVRRRIGLHASTKGLVPPEEGMRKNAVFTRLLPSTTLLHPRVRVYVLQKIILQPITIIRFLSPVMCHSDKGNMWLYATEVLRKEDRYRLSLQCKSEIKKSCFQAGQQIQQISTDTSDLHQPNLRVLPSIDM
ncbi:hypothetical protein YC2023_017838 [Brassica napus]